MNTLKDLYTRHPNLVSWAVLAAAMVIVLWLAARDVGFQPTQWLALIGATVALAGACVWIISWETPGETDEP
jgi:hypothetical protein